MSSSQEYLTENLKSKGGLEYFNHFSSQFEDKTIARLLLRKNVFPYDYMNDESKFLETSLPAKEAFYSSVKKAQISDGKPMCS